MRCIKVLNGLPIAFRSNGLFDLVGMASPLLGIAGVNSLLFAAYGASKRIISPFPQLSLKEIAAAGAMAGAANAVLASPGMVYFQATSANELTKRNVVEMFKVRMQGQYGAATDQRLREVVREMWSEWGFRRGVMRGYWVRSSLFDTRSQHSRVSRLRFLERFRLMQGMSFDQAKNLIDFDITLHRFYTGMLSSPECFVDLWTRSGKRLNFRNASLPRHMVPSCLCGHC